jgi:hypothetical protein
VPVASKWGGKNTSVASRNTRRVHPNFAKIAECARQRLIIKDDNKSQSKLTNFLKGEG